MSEDDRRVGPCDKYCAVVDECEARGGVIRELRAENEKLRSILFQFAAYNESVGNVEMFTMTVPAGVIHAAADALKEAGDE